MSQVIVVTGGASGLGRAIALKWASLGARVCIADIHAERATAVIEEIHQLGGEGLFVETDVTSEESLHNLAKLVWQRWQQVDYLVNNAGVATAGSLNDEPITQWQWVLDVNLLGVVRGCQAFEQYFKQQGYGYIINVASQAGITPAPMMGSYNAAKAAVVAFSETLKLELAADNIQVSVVCPAFFKTNLHESMRTQDPHMKAAMHRLFAKASLTAEDVAAHIHQGVQQRKFMLVPDKLGSKAFKFKRFAPENWYFKMMGKRTGKMRRNQ